MKRRWMLGAVLAGMAILPPLQAGAPEPANSCTDPYWQNSLRCRALQVLAPNPMPPPQPPPPAPATLAQIRAYTRVELVDPDVRCVDGTRPILYVDRAVDPDSNKWLITMTGGEFCAAQDLDGNGSFETGNECLRAYVEQHAQQMGSAGEAAMSDLKDPDGSGNGILNPDPEANPVFAGYHRVRVHKCGFDRHSGRATHPGVVAQWPGGGPSLSYDLYSHGQKIVLAALDLLHGDGLGLSYTTWTASGGVVAETSEHLPSIADATQVLLVGHSAAGHGLYQNADRYAEHLRAMPGFEGDVRSVHDAHFMAMVENEAAFDPAQNPDPATLNTLFDQRTAGTTAAGGAYDSYRYHGHPDSHFADDYRAWAESPGAEADILDASCVATHAATNDVWKCADRFHIRLHHLSTPALSREDFSDPNQDHGNWPWGYILWWGELAQHAHCDGVGADLFPFAPCPPVLAPAQIRQRLLVQASHFRAGIHTMSELALDADPSADSGSVYLWMPDCTNHGGVYDDHQFYGTSIVRDGSIQSYREFLEAFVAAPSHGVIETRVDGLDGAVSECGPLLLKDSFD